MLIGQETEYAIRYSPHSLDSAVPSKKLVFQAFKEAIASQYYTCAGSSSQEKSSFFCENGGAFCFESRFLTPGAGLLEGATPECSSALELIRYQRAQEAMILDSISSIEETLSLSGYEGSIGFIKNERDAKGNIYGTQENYSASIASGISHKIVNLVSALTVFSFALVNLFVYTFVILITLGFICSLALLALLFRLTRSITPKLSAAYQHFHSSLYSSESEWLESMVMRFIGRPLTWAYVIPFTPWQILARVLVFRPHRGALESHLISRIIFTGAGSVDEHGQLSISEKATVKRRLMLWLIRDEKYPVFETGHFFKAFHAAANGLLLFNTKKFSPLFKQQQRLQLSLSDSNRCEYAEWLKIGSTQLIVKMVEQGFALSPPRFIKPSQVLEKMNRDFSLSQKFKTKAHGELNALEVQEWYIEQAKEFLHSSAVVQPEDHDLIEQWENVIQSLKSKEHKNLLGRIDWINKKYLLENMPTSAGSDEWKKLDTKYHEIGTGYFDQLTSLNLSLLSDEEVETAKRQPPNTKPARLRGRIISDPHYLGPAKKISWASAFIDEGDEKKVISLHDFIDEG